MGCDVKRFKKIYEFEQLQILKILVNFNLNLLFYQINYLINT